MREGCDAVMMKTSHSPTIHILQVGIIRLQVIVQGDERG